MSKRKDILNNNKFKKSGFLLPQDYFESFEENLQNKRNKLTTGFKVPDDYFKKSDGIILSKQAKINNGGFQIPENYFNTLDSTLITKTKKSVKVRKLNTLKIISLSVAASLLLFFGVNRYNQSKNYTNFSSFNQNDFTYWVDEGLISYSYYDMEEVFSDIDLEMVIVDQDEIYNYLENTDIEDLIIE